jgi:hypothetical protein
MAVNVGAAEMQDGRMDAFVTDTSGISGIRFERQSDE